jgi:hypothetical protein
MEDYLFTTEADTHGSGPAAKTNGIGTEHGYYWKEDQI